ncbi:hypothetical protein [Cognatiyoonia sp. IB215182]|uniref:hypothetical protein n=1 Tax=Cognatiyoonia sp. IB215182 TaxID=3097353 RepID=UPI002A115FA8|nr:hypothetical protein [Cognatiyoonia sp. IB215182]MDX8355381.1 hypothetical protein [Cognatiyoonia sp. IB215182]
MRERRSRRKHYLAAMLAIGAVYAGFFVEAVPLVVAVLPFVAALCMRWRMLRGLIVAPYFLAIALMAGWGLIQMGYAPWLVIMGGLVAAGLCSAMVGSFGVTISLLVLAIIPFFPGHPLLATGFFIADSTIWSLALVIAGCGAIEGFRSKRRYSNSFAVAMILAGVLGLAMQSFTSGSQSGRELASSESWEEVATNASIMSTKRGKMMAVITQLQDGETYITGENILASQDHLEIQMLCRVLPSRNATVYLGIQEAGTGRAQVRILRPDSDCRDLPLAYAAQVGIPGITGNPWPFLPAVIHQDDMRPHTQWLSCIEGFSLASWLRVSVARPANVIIIANDYWTEPLPIAGLRRKISADMGRLLGVRVFHADSGHNILRLAEGAVN